ncbi:hypothetical protein [Lacipirellula sp.]|uniref:hypothetical protein n=1 Tax=Lacipirellula sp. TaxID=2691419 RepID=UPI003D120E1F
MSDPLEKRVRYGFLEDLGDSFVSELPLHEVQAIKVGERVTLSLPCANGGRVELRGFVASMVTSSPPRQVCVRWSDREYFPPNSPAPGGP